MALAIDVIHVISFFHDVDDAGGMMTTAAGREREQKRQDESLSPSALMLAFGQYLEFMAFENCFVGVHYHLEKEGVSARSLDYLPHKIASGTFASSITDQVS
ncbi:hypothetical protein MN608_03297 [Microdochium nivale]|nr:hypothetical protein MN608_03297 [Microdochium nivale]